MLKSFKYPCWSDPQGAAYLQPLETEMLTMLGPVLVYPINRVPETRLANSPVCGNCKIPLFSGKPIELTSQNFDKQIQKNDKIIRIDITEG